MQRECGACAIKSTLDHAEPGLGVCGLGARKALTSLTSISRSLPSPSTHTAFPSTVILLTPYSHFGNGGRDAEEEYGKCIHMYQDKIRRLGALG